MDLKKINDFLRDKSPGEIVEWALETANRPVVTTNFRPYEAAILHATTGVKSDIPVIWCDTGYNTPQTYRHAERLIESLGLNIDLYVPRQTSAHRDVVMGIPDIDSPLHKEFTEQVKLEPFRRAMSAHQPDVWFTNLRKGQTAFRDSLDIVTLGSDGVLKVSPFFYWTDEELDEYLEEHRLENEFKYFDPTKVLENRECGLHIPAQKQTVSS
ncbi:phosphoadenosine phosphosulfate reductase family protein [Sinomicrobium weinanense]|uniref:Phosphoadenosine phosphosulfate reductase family protein n=1 Tax=Sinomicrobium weinanense TaxID=2842200 RepID=A0A926Q1A6_9FLAO|nr:phosphoadenosine phosphosulfate reductase family protein [Sinomicrobium weinanense]MBC9795607.1 phosphoadenosine phosphosulfate reductase family protein [Sinomicrobium weinanense]MBU3124628.1 phosphoadenosine phosphosulfate reductase family protein [Sinomicrobium weinanense]